MKPILLVFCLFFFILLYTNGITQPLTWIPVANGVWKASAGSPEAYNLLSAAGVLPEAAGLASLPNAAFPFGSDRGSATLTDNHTYLHFPLDRKEQLYGFGLNFQTVNQRGKILELHVDHYGGRDNGRTHAPVPFYVSSRGYGIFINSARYLTVYAGTAVEKNQPSNETEKDRNTDKTWSAQPYSGSVDMLVPAAGAEVYIFAGPTALDAICRFNLFNGGGCLPPRWGLGFTQRVKSLNTATDIEQEADEFSAKGYPLDFIGLEPGWQSRAYPGSFTWDSTRFPSPQSFIPAMLKRHIRLNCWINPYVSSHAPFYRDIFPFTASHLVWGGLVPDFTIAKARSLFFGQLETDQVIPGISGYKIDEVDGYDNWLWPDVATFPGQHAAEQMRQTYGLLLQRYSTDLFHALNRRTYGLVRASNAGGVSFPYVIYNDYYKHEDFITALINSGFSGVLWTPEVRASGSAEEWLRRMQTVIFSPMAMINAWASGTKPWSYPEVAAQVKELALLRMRMMPYWYSMFARYHFEGRPPFRAVNLEPGFMDLSADAAIDNSLEKNPYAMATRQEIKDEYMAGDNLLVAPLFTGQQTRTVILPRGKWYDFYTGAYAGNGELITVSPGRDKIPVFVRDGAIIPLQPPLLHAPAAGEKTDLECRHYGEKEGLFNLYDDDGETFDYEKGAFSWRTITVQKNKNGQWQGSVSPPEKNKPDNIGRVTFRHMQP